MARFDFDLENARHELGQANDLLEIFSEFCEEECPSKPQNADSASAVWFASRIMQYKSLVDAAQSKIVAMTEVMNTAIENYYAEKKAKGGDVA